MTFPADDRVKALWTGTGTGTMTLGGAVSGEGVQAFTANLDGQVVGYLIQHATNTEAEAGIGIYTHAGTTLSRLYRTYPTRGGAAVSFSAGDKHVSNTPLHLFFRPNLSTSDPTVNDDINAGFIVGMEWINTSAGKYFKLRSHAAGAAVWVQIDGAGGGGGGLTPVDDNNTSITFNDALDGTKRRLTAGSAIAITLSNTASVGTRIGALTKGAGVPTATPASGATYLLPGDTSGRTAAFVFDVGEFEVVGNSDGSSAVWDFTGNSDHTDLADNALDMNGEVISNAKTPYPASEVTASRSLALDDADQKKLKANHATVAIVLTVAPDATVDFPIGTAIPIIRWGAAAVSVAEGSGVTINKPSDRTLALRAQYAEGVLWKEGANTWAFSGDLTAA